MAETIEEQILESMTQILLDFLEIPRIEEALKIVDNS